MAAHGGLKTPTQGGAVDRGDDDFRRRFHFFDHFRQPGVLARLVEFGDVGAGDEGATGADQDGDLGILVGDELAHAILQAGTDRQRQGVDRRAVDGDVSNIAFAAVADYVSHGVILSVLRCYDLG